MWSAPHSAAAAPSPKTTAVTSEATFLAPAQSSDNKALFSLIT